MSGEDSEPAATSAEDLPAQYRAGRTASILVARPDVSRLLVRGRDALDLLHRLSTNDLKGIRDGEGAATVFTTNKGRILDLVTLHHLPEGLLVLCGESRSGTLKAWIEKYTFREEVSVEDWTGSHGTLGLHGPRSGDVAATLWGPVVAALPLHHVAAVPAGRARALIVRAFPIGGDSYLIIAPPVALESLRQQILQAEGIRPIEAGRDCLELLRIEAGLPASGRELTEEHNPWEARLQDAISLSKGCYVGQEVVARLHTYRKVSRQLVRLTARGGAGEPVGEVVVPGAPILIGDELAGEVTSSALMPAGGNLAVALGYVRESDAVAGRRADIVRAGVRVPATIEGVAR